MLKKKLLILNTTIMLGLISPFTFHDVQAETPIQDQRAAVQEDITKANQEMINIMNELSQLTGQINRVDQAIEDNQNMIVETEEKISATKAEVEELEKEIVVIEERIAVRFEILKQRAISYQQSGGTVSYLEVLIGAQSFGDFIERAVAVAKFAKADSDLMEEATKDKAELEEKQALVEKKLTDLTEMKVELEGMQSQILEQKKQNDQLRAELEKKEEDNIEWLTQLRNTDEYLAEKEVALAEQSQRTSSESSNQTTVTSTDVTADSEQVNTTTATETTTTSNITEQTNTSAPKAAPAKPAPVKTSGSLSEAISASYRYIGNSVYVFGGGRSSYDIANGRFDCSGFVSYVFSQAGIKISSSTSALRYEGRQIPASQMKYGDLVFFNTYKQDGHVGIYVGNGKFIGSQSSTGVAVANMTSGYWKQHFNGRVVRVN